MSKFTKFTLLGLGCLILSSFVLTKDAKTIKKFKCLVQLINYTGEGAYIVVSVLDKNGKYLSTLQVLGDDEEWYPDLPNWWDYHTANSKPDIDGITGATISGGERSIFVLDIDQSLLDAGNTLLFETAVEDQDYHDKDLAVPLNTNSLSGKFEGNGYIRYVRMIPNS